MSKIMEVIPICAWCKKLRTKENIWIDSQIFFENADKDDLNRISHGICPNCKTKVCLELTSSVFPS